MQTADSRFGGRIRQSTKKLFLWVVAWLLATAALRFGPQLLWDAPTATFLAFAFALAVGIGMVVANKNYLNTLDEMQRQLLLNAMAIASALPLILGIPYLLLESYGIAPFHAGLEHLIILMSLTYVTAYITMMRRFW